MPGYNVPALRTDHIVQGGAGLANGIAGAGRSLQQGMTMLGQSMQRDQERLQIKQDELDSLTGRMEFYADMGLIDESALREIENMDVSKAQGYLTALEADTTRRVKQGDRMAYLNARGGGSGGGGLPIMAAPGGDGADALGLGSTILTEGGRLVLTGQYANGTPKFEYHKFSDAELAAQRNEELVRQGKQAELAELEAKIERGGDKWGPDWMPFVPSRGVKAAGLRAQLGETGSTSNVERPTSNVQSGQLVQIRSQADYEQLKSGEQFIYNGKVLTKK